MELRERTAQTAAEYFEKAQRPEIRAMLPQAAQTLEEALAAFEQSKQPGASSYGRTIWADGRYLGDVWCYAMDAAQSPQAMVSYCILDPDDWGRGYAGEALALFLGDVRERFGLTRFGAFTYAANLASIRVLEKNGFVLRERFWEDETESCYFETA